MPDLLDVLERAARVAHRLSRPDGGAAAPEHAFVVRDIHDALPADVRRLFDNSHYAQSATEAFKYVDKQIQRLSGLTSKSGEALMMEALKEEGPKVVLTPCSTMSERDEQRGYRFLFAGAIVGIRNPRSHEFDIADDLETCLNHLSLATLLLRRLERAGHTLT